jgi:hypothetical protein
MRCGWHWCLAGKQQRYVGRHVLIPWTDSRATNGRWIELTFRNLQERHRVSLHSSIYCFRKEILTCLGCSQLFEFFHAPTNLLPISLPLFCHTRLSRHVTLIVIIFSVSSCISMKIHGIVKIYIFCSCYV